LALKEAEEAANRRDARGERIGILMEFSSTAIKAGQLRVARKFANRLRYYGKEFYLWNQYAHIALAWIDLKEGRHRAFRRKRELMHQLFLQHPSHAAGSNAAVSFVQNALDLGRTEDALQLIATFIAGLSEHEKKDEKQEFDEWAAAIAEGRKPRLTIMRKLARLY
jgi:hypothetical protein